MITGTASAEPALAHLITAWIQLKTQELEHELHVQ